MRNLKLLPQKKTKLPDRPIDYKAAQAETLLVNATEDKEKLTAAGLDWSYVEDLKTLPGALRYSQAQWMSEYRAKQEAQKQWKEESPLAYKLRNDMLHHLGFAYRNDEDLTQKVRRIREGSGHKDMLQDLLELAILAENNPEPLTKIAYDVTLNEKAKTTSHDLSELLALHNGTKDDSSEIKQIRDKAFTLLDIRVREIMAVGQYVFWQDPDRKEKYTDDYK